MTMFTRAELLDLEPEDLAELLDVADGSDPMEKAESLGLNLHDVHEKVAWLRALKSRDMPVPESYSPPIGAGQPGVRQDLTPGEAAELVAATGDPVPVTLDLGAVEADPTGAREIALLMDRSAETGEPFLGGTFAMYAAPNGDVWMVTEGIGDGVRRSMIPRKWVRAALQLMAGEGGMKSRMLGKIFGRG